MIRIAKEIDYEKLEDLKKKINDREYLESAIHVIAQELTNNLCNEKEE